LEDVDQEMDGDQQLDQIIDSESGVESSVQDGSKLGGIESHRSLGAEYEGFINKLEMKDA
jgi:hypothetical protein